MKNEKKYINPYIVYLARLLRGHFSDALRAEGVFGGQHELIGVLYHNPGITASTLARKLDLSQATVSVSMKRLERSGFIKKETDKSDSRTVKLFLTDEGKKAFEKVGDAMIETEKRLVSGFTEEEIVLFRDFLRKGIDNLTESDSPSILSREFCEFNRGDKRW